MEKENKKLTELNSHQLCLITADDLEDPMKDMDENEKKAYVATVASAYEVLSKEIKNAMAKQEHFIGTTATSWEGVLIGRGSINMAYLLHERFDDLKAQHIDNIKPEEKFDKHEVI